MSSRRGVLTSNPNAANSPFRAAAAAKQKRSFANVQREETYGHPPPAKRVMMEAQTSTLRTPTRAISGHLAVDGRPFIKRSNPVEFTKQLAAARRNKPVQQQSQRADIAPATLDDVRSWQKHYRQAFPDFVFYFESVPEESRGKVRRQIAALNASEAKFFSNTVTHVITTRSIPKRAENAISSTHSQNEPLQTINPVLLDRSSESTHNQAEMQPSKGRFTFDVSTGRKLNNGTQDADTKRNHARSTDVLHRAQELNIKIWTFEKLQKVMTTLFDVDTGAQVPHSHNTRSNSHGGLALHSRATREADLSQLLRNERINGPSDRDLSVVKGEMNVFKGPFIYIHDFDEKQRPIMVREYKKVAHKEDGDWPQFRSVTSGRCPFVEEVDYTQRDAERELLKKQRKQERERENAVPPRTRAAAAAVEAARMQPPKITTKRALSEIPDGDNRRNASATTQEARSFKPDEEPSIKPLDVEPSSKDPQNAFVSRAAPGRFFGGEPVASGVQPSNITSAIRSQMVSSTAAAPGAKAGTSKEVYGLQRKVLEKNSAPTSHAAQQRLTASHRMLDIAAAAREENASRLTKRKGQEKLSVTTDAQLQVDAEENVRRTEAAERAKAVQKRKVVKRDPKPGYCENCQDKFEDFEEHIQSRKHRRFAEKNENWKDLDALLKELVRPLKYHALEDDDYC